MEIESRRICDLVADCPEAEDILENAGVDYWFGWERTLQAACEAANVDPKKVIVELEACPRSIAGEPQPVDFATLLRESDQIWLDRLSPAIAAALNAASTLKGERVRETTDLIGELQEQLARHMASSAALLPLADAIERRQASAVSRETVRKFRLDHLEFARIARDLRGNVEELQADTNAQTLALALRTVIREIHHHIKLAYNFILPRLVAAAPARTVAAEPW